MARPQQFIEDQALDNAMALFWRQGYHATSMKDLVEYTGVCRASLYKTFGNKEELFEQSLHRYRALMQRLYGRQPAEDESSRDFLYQFFIAKVDEITEENPQGCMVTNTTTELYQKDERIQQLIEENQQQQLQWLEQLLERDIARGDLAADTNTTVLAHYLFMSLQGLTISAMTHPDKDRLYSLVDLILEKI